MCDGVFFGWLDDAKGDATARHNVILNSVRPSPAVRSLIFANRAKLSTMALLQHIGKSIFGRVAGFYRANVAKELSAVGEYDFKPFHSRERAIFIAVASRRIPIHCRFRFRLVE